MSTDVSAIWALTKLAAECHRAKWQFDLNYKLSPLAARGLIAKGFDELHRIGDEAIKLRDQIKLLEEARRREKQG